MGYYADIIIPLAAEGTFTYSIPDELAGRAVVGLRAVVSFGRKKYYTGIIRRIHSDPPHYRNVKPILSLAHERPVASELQLRLWEWMAEYYMCSVGEVMQAAVPRALKSRGDSGELSETYAPRFESRLRFPEGLTEEILNEQLVSLNRATKQQEALTRLAGYLWRTGRDSVARKTFLEETGVSPAMITALERKGYAESFSREVSRFGHSPEKHREWPCLTDEQSAALSHIREGFENNRPVLLHGVTGSGKTEIYIHLIKETIERGKDILYLLPEIALTTQLIERLEVYFGSRLLVYHSRFNENKRAECYLNVLDSEREPILLLGVRSSVLLPHSNPGLIIVDEEHDTSFKQEENAPRYHARDTAVVLAGMSGAKILMGSATPSVESYFNAVTGKYELAKLTNRYGNASLPKIILSDIVRAAKRGEKVSHFSRILLETIARETEAGNQSILFQNRRGFSPYLECGECFYVPTCVNCHVSLTYHKHSEAMVCHYCGHHAPLPESCPKCGQGKLKTMGFGTEKIEEELERLFPEARIARLDLDTTRSAKSFGKIVSAFRDGRIDILVGTRMVTKGFDFNGVTLVGVLNADNSLNMPDFRAAERSFQVLTQVAGRSGRRQTEGTVIIQTSQPEHPVLRQVLHNDYEGMFRCQIAERKEFHYPPFFRLIRFTLKHTKREVLRLAANEFNHKMRKTFGARLLGPEWPAVDKIRNEYLCCFLLKVEREKSFAEAKKLCKGAMEAVGKLPGMSTLSVIADVDPQ